MSFMQHLCSCNHFRPDEFVPLMVDDVLTGRFRPAFAAHLLEFEAYLKCGRLEQAAATSW